MKYTILKIVFAVWVGLWLFFFARELFIKDNLRDYKALATRDLGGKHAYVTGERLYGFLKLCKDSLPSHATYKLTGIEDGSIEKRRAVYYLYPLVESNDPDFVLVYGKTASEDMIKRVRVR
jgi:hypothetical protein